MEHGWPAWAIFPVLAILIVPGTLFAWAITAYWNSRWKRDAEWRRQNPNKLRWCAHCDEFMLGHECFGDALYCGRSVPKGDE